MKTCTKRLEFDYGHRVLGHQGKCRHLHGHRGVAELTIQADDLDKLGMVIDFGILKDVVGHWIDANWDHNLILNAKDPLIEAIQKLNKLDPHPHEAVDWSDVVFDRPPFIMNCNPTAENLASCLFDNVKELLEPHPVEIIAVQIWETPSSYAVYREDK